MRQRSLAGPIVLLVVGGVFLWNNLRPDVPMWDIMAQWWPFVLIGWGLIRLAEVLISPARRSARAFGGGEIVLVVLLCLIGSALYQGRRIGIHFPGRGVEVFGEEHAFPVNAQAPAAGIKRIVFENARGNVRVAASDAQDIRVTGHKVIRAYTRAEAERASDNTPLELVPQGDHLLVRTNQDRIGHNQRISCDLEVTAPAGVALEARGRRGDFDFSGVSGDVEITSDNAGVRLAKIGGNVRINLRRSDIIRAVEVKGNVDVQGGGEDIDLDNVAGQVTINGSYSGALTFKNIARPLRFDSRNSELRVEAIPGQITMNLAEFNARNVSGPIRLVTKSRDVRVAEFTNSLEVETERGDIELDPGKLPLPKIQARSRTGRIDLALPEKAAFELQATAEHGDTVNDYGPAIQKVTEGRTASLKGQVGNGPSINLTTGRATVTVRKSGGPKSLPITEARF